MQVDCKYAEHDELLRAAGLRRTRARQAVLAALTSTGRPMTPAQLAAVSALKRRNTVTIYRTLTTLRAFGLLHVVHGVDGAAMFCANRSGPGCPGGHLHFQCLECGEMHCVHGQRLPRVSLGADVIVKAKQLVAFGLCARCAKPSVRKGVRTRKPPTERS